MLSVFQRTISLVLVPWQMVKNHCHAHTLMYPQRTSLPPRPGALPHWRDMHPSVRSGRQTKDGVVHVAVEGEDITVSVQ